MIENIDSNPEIDLGMEVELELTTDEGKERMKVIIVPEESADFARGFLGINTPLATAILYHRSGDQIAYRSGDIHAVKVLSVKKSQTQPSDGAAARREAALKKAADEVDRTNAMLFASSFSGKWGDYDPKAADWEENETKPDRPEDDPAG